MFSEASLSSGTRGSQQMAAAYAEAAAATPRTVLAGAVAGGGSPTPGELKLSLSFEPKAVGRVEFGLPLELNGVATTARVICVSLRLTSLLYPWLTLPLPSVRVVRSVRVLRVRLQVLMSQSLT